MLIALACIQGTLMIGCLSGKESTATETPMKPTEENVLYKTDLVTRWGSDVTPENAWTEYPRPQMERENWQNLNGLWDYAITPITQADPPDAWAGN